jgi:FAD:protein FMN transferase
MMRVEFRAVGTHCSVAVTPGGRGAARALEAARAEVAACERALSRFDARSDLTRLNASAGAWVPVDVRLREALLLALRARRATHGRFDPTVLPALAAAGYDRSFELLQDRPAAKPPVDWRAGAAFEVDDVRGCARVERGAAVDLGGIGKGYAAQRALAAMRDASPGLRGAIVDLGGDLAIWGTPPLPGPWRIGIDDPRGGSAGVLVLPDGGGIATSGRDVRRFGPQRTLHHLIDPATGEPAQAGPLAVTVVAASAAEAEAHATALAVSSFDQASAHVAATPGIAALWIPAYGASVPLGALPLAGRHVVVAA